MNTIRSSIPSSSLRCVLTVAAVVLGFLCAAATALHAAAYTVNDLGDTRPTLGGAGSGTAGDLRYCITQANYGAAGSTHTISFTVTGTITLAAHELVINTDLTITGPGSAKVTIDANNASRVFFIAASHTVKISGLSLTKGNGIGNDATGIDTGSTFLGYGGAVYNDRSILTLAGCAINGNAANQQGGAVFNDAKGANATLTVSNCSINTNSTKYDDGGGIYNFAHGGAATLTVTGTTISNNTAGGDGGGIHNYGLGSPANATISNCTISGNSAAGNYGGGGIRSTGASGGSASSMIITDSVISGNSATGIGTSYGGGGGGILNGGASNSTMTLRNCAVSDNSSNKRGGGISNDGFLSTATLTLINCTIDGNTAGTSGAGIFNYGEQAAGTLNVNNCTISGNSAQQRGGGIYNLGTGSTNFGTASMITVNNTTISGNSALSGGAGVANDQPQAGGNATVTVSNTILALHPTGANFGTAFGTNVSGGFNLSDDASCGAFLTGTGDRNSTLAGLQVDGTGKPLLQDNGGPIKTIALVVGSSAIDAGKAANDPLTGLPATTDQRGFSRPFNIASVVNASGGDGSDIGAFEFGSGPVINVSANPVAGGTVSGGGVHAFGSSTTVTATPNSAYLFGNWTEGATVVSTSPSYMFTATAGRTLVANFAPKSNNAKLSKLTVSAGTLVPAFAATTTGYTDSVSNATTSIRVTPTVADSTATIQVRVNGGPYANVTSGSQSGALSLNLGANSVDVKVTAQNLTTVSIYTVAVTRVGSPLATTLAASGVIFNGATLNGTAIPNGLATTVHFDYGLTATYGSSTANQNVGAGTSAVPVQAVIGNLTPNTTYHYRAVATNSNGTTDGLDRTFTTPDFAVVGTWAERTVARNLPAVGSEVDIGTLTFTGGTGSIEAAVNASGSGWSVAKRYVIPIRYNLGNGSPPATWLKVLPTHDTGPYGANDFDLNVYVTNATVQLRLRTVGSNGNAATARIAVKTTGLQTFANASGTATVPVLPTLTIGGNAVDEVKGQAGIGAAPSANAVLDINGGDTRGLHLRPRSVLGAPTSGTWNMGTIILDSGANLFICTAPGTPGTWMKVGN